MTTREYSPGQALSLLLKKLDTQSPGLAAQVRVAIDAGKDVEEKASNPRRKKPRSYRKAVPLSEEEALAAAVDVLQAYFVEQPLFVASAMDNAKSAAVAGPRQETVLGSGNEANFDAETGRDDEKMLDIELRAETQLTVGGDETLRLKRPVEAELEAEREILARVRALTAFGRK